MPERYPQLDRPARLSDRVTAQIEGLVANGTLRPGDRLPPERELGDQFGVSRTVIREAVRALVAKGLLDVRAGDGTVIRQPSSGVVSDALVFLLRAQPGAVAYTHLREVRATLEPDIAAIAARRRTDEDLRSLRHELDVMRRPDTSPESWARADVSFHATLARATHNPIYGVILNSIQDLLLEVRLLAIQLPETRVTAAQHHEAVYRAVESGLGPAARKAMVTHLHEAEQTQKQALHGTNRRPGPDDRGLPDLGTAST